MDSVYPHGQLQTRFPQLPAFQQSKSLSLVKLDQGGGIADRSITCGYLLAGVAGKAGDAGTYLASMFFHLWWLLRIWHRLAYSLENTGRNRRS